MIVDGFFREASGDSSSKRLDETTSFSLFFGSIFLFSVDFLLLRFEIWEEINSNLVNLVNLDELIKCSSINLVALWGLDYLQAE